jgi:anti-anti-sigma regulatory factor
VLDLARLTRRDSMGLGTLVSREVTAQARLIANTM